MNQETNYLLGILSAQIRSNGYQARLEIDRLTKHILAKQDARRLELHGRKIHSQGDEDGILDEIILRIWGKPTRGYFLEVGVQNGLECNTRFLLHSGWRGHWVEMDGHSCIAISRIFANELSSGQLTLTNEKSTPLRLEAVSEEAMAPQYSEIPKIASIDVDGMDYYLFDHLNESFDVVVVEYNAKFPPNCDRIPVFSDHYSWNGTEYMGSSLKSLTQLANKKGYSLVGTSITGVNAFFVKNSLINHQFCQVNSVTELYNPPRYYLIHDHFAPLGHRPGHGAYL